MPHSIIILGQKADCVIGLATAAGDDGLVNATQSLKDSANALHNKLEANLVPPLQRGDAHQALVNAQQLLQDMCDNENITEMENDVVTADNAIKAFL